MPNLHPEERDQSKKPRLGTTFSVEFPQLPTMTQRPYEAELIQKRGNHDVLKLIFKQTGREWTEDIPTGLPVKFSWTQNRITHTWVGYVSHVSRSVRSNRDGLMDVVCLGSSFPLKKKQARVFSECSIPEAVKSLAEEVGLEFVGDFSARTFPQLIIAGQSYWAWIQEQANRLGYVAYVEGITLYFQKLNSAIDSRQGSAPLFSLANNEIGLDSQGVSDRTLTTFKVLRGDYLETGDTVRASVSTGGVAPTTTQVVGGESSPTDVASTRSIASEVLFSTQRTDQTTFSQKDSQELAENLAQLARFTMPAKISGAGDYRCRPNGVVLVQGTGKTTDGYWLIKDVIHTFNMYGMYTVEMTVLSDGVGATTLKSFESDKTFGRDVLNISEKLSPSGAVTSTKPNSSPTLSTPTIPILVRDLNFKTSDSRWKAK